MRQWLAELALGDGQENHITELLATGLWHLQEDSQFTLRYCKQDFALEFFFKKKNTPPLSFYSEKQKNDHMCVGMEGTMEQDTQCLQMFQKAREAFLTGAHYGYHHPRVCRGDKFQYISMAHMVPVIIPISCQNQNCENTHTHTHIKI